MLQIYNDLFVLVQDLFWGIRYFLINFNSQNDYIMHPSTRFKPSWLSFGILLYLSPLGATVLIDNDFGGGSDVGPAFQEVNNNFSSPAGNIGSADTNTGVIDRGGNFNFVGFNNVSTVDVTSTVPSATGFTATFVISGLSDFDANQVDSNGMFFGIVSGTNAAGTAGTSIWANDPNAFGYVTSSDNFGNHLVRQDAESGGNANSADNTSLTTTAPTTASFADGFTISISLFRACPIRVCH